MIDGKIKDIIRLIILNKKDVYEKTILPLYKIYQQKLIDLNSCDFGDLILHTVKILKIILILDKFIQQTLNIF